MPKHAATNAVFTASASNVPITLSTCAVCSADLDPLPFDCQEAYVLGCRRSGVYTIDPGCASPSLSGVT